MALLGPKKDGGPNIEFFQSAEALQGFETVRLWLQRNCKKVIECIELIAAILSTIHMHFHFYETKKFRSQRNHIGKKYVKYAKILSTKKIYRKNNFLNMSVMYDL